MSMNVFGFGFSPSIALLIVVSGVILLKSWNYILTLFKPALILAPGVPYPDGVYQIALPSMPHVFYPPKAMRELFTSKSATFPAHTSDILLGKYTYQGEENMELKAGIRAMSNNLDVVIKSFEADVAYAFETVFGSCDEWTTVDQIWPATFRIASIMSSRPFLGRELSRDPEWFTAMTEYSHLDRYFATGKDFKSRRTAAIHSDGGELLDWMISEYSNPIPKKLARDEVTIILESVMNISGGIGHLLFNIAKYSEYQEPLREEYEEVMHEFGGLNKAAVFKMKKMDSFMKETQRLNPPSMMAIMRKVVDPNGMKLSVGPRIPCGTLCAVSADRANMSPEFFSEPTKFDGYRFYRMRQAPGEEFRHQLTSTSDSEINFSLGGRACPGRIFLSALEKTFLAHLLTHYDVRVKPGHENEESRYIDGIRVVINPKAIIQLRRKKNA
ncbi:cytochrome P450 [Phyllosticta citrichinensis]